MKQVFIFVVLLILIFQSQPVYAWLNCPFGILNDPYPGLDPRYVDTDNDGICDLSQPAPEERNTQTTSLTNTYRQTTMKYYVLEITIILLILFGLSRYLIYLSKETKNEFLKKFNEANIRYWLNIVLLVSFCLTLITGFLDLARLQLGWLQETKINIVWWHIESGIIMVVVGLIHAILHWRYFVNFFKRKRFIDIFRK